MLRPLTSGQLARLPLSLRIARLAASRLGRTVRHGSRAGRDGHDWAATDAIKAAAWEVGLTGPLGGWVRRGRTLTQYAADYIARYCQAYGPVGDLIDVSAYGRTPAPPAIVEVRCTVTHGASCPKSLTEVSR